MLVATDRRLMAKNIRFLRSRRKMSRNQFSLYIDISPNQLFCIENKMINYIYWKPLVNISEIYGISTDEILTEDLEEKYRNKRFHYSR